jgi:Tol biopolymer transport system component
VSDAESDIYVSNANGRGARQLTHHGGEQPVWSPDGKYIAFVRDDGLYVIRRDGRSLRRIVSIPPFSFTSTKWLVISSPSWQPLPR